MTKYIIRRIIYLIPVLIGVSILSFMLIHLIPGDPAQIILGQHASESALNELRQNLGLNDPLYIQYLHFVSNVLQGDFGRSIVTHSKVLDEMATYFPATLELSIAAIIIAIVVGVSAGVIAAVKQYSWFDNLSMIGALMGVSFPIFWLGLIMMWLFGLVLGWLPPSARLDPSIHLQTVTNIYFIDAIITGNWAAFKDVVAHLVMPSVALGTIPMAIIARMTRSSMLEVMRQDYIRTARAKGLAEWIVIVKHALKNAFLPVLTVIGLQFGTLMGGAVLTETIFSWPGIGRLMYHSIMSRDFPMVQGGILIIATIFVIVNLLVDIMYTFIDPRIRYN